MIDPANLPGLATHLAASNLCLSTACGLVIPDRITLDVNKVNCLRCRKTLRYRQLKKRVDKSDNPD